jgi:mannose-6-phosphate isomerase-like protein (cupin superfamily)
MNANKINLEQKFALFTEHWTPKIIEETNGQFVKIAKAQGDMIWHSHEHEDELFIVFKGCLSIHLRDSVIELKPGELFVVPKAVEHRTSAVEETHFMMIEPKSTAHTGTIQSEQTVSLERQERI